MPFPDEAPDKPEVNINFQLTRKKWYEFIRRGRFSHLHVCMLLDWRGDRECLKEVKGRSDKMYCLRPYTNRTHEECISE